MLKYKPKLFWKMFQRKDGNECDVDMPAFAKFNQSIFHDPHLPTEDYSSTNNSHT